MSVYDYDQPTTFRAPESLLEDCRNIAKAGGSNLSKQMRRLLEEYRDQNIKRFSRLDSGRLIQIRK